MTPIRLSLVAITALALCHLATAMQAAKSPDAGITNSPEIVHFVSDSKTLGGELFKPEGLGPFPAILYNHGSAPGILNSEASNDFDIEPSKVLLNEMKQAGKEAEMKIYPAFGKSDAEGHSFAYEGASIWFADVLSFLERHCSSGERDIEK